MNSTRTAVLKSTWNLSVTDGCGCCGQGILPSSERIPQTVWLSEQAMRHGREPRCCCEAITPAYRCGVNPGLSGWLAHNELSTRQRGHQSIGIDVMTTGSAARHEWGRLLAEPVVFPC
jgi:hypothetical protein